MSVSLCVSLWAQPGEEDGLVAYEDAVLAMIPEHGGRVVQRARTDGSGNQPLEVQLFEFQSEAGLDAYLADTRRVALTAQRERVVKQTEIMRVTLV